jgi:hypothetical protein
MARRKRIIGIPGSKKRLIQPGIHTMELPELFARLRAVESTSKNQSVTIEAQEWNGNMSYQAALDAAEFGQWNAPKIKSLSLPELAGLSDEVTYSYDVTGHHFDVAAFVSGEPEYWQVEEPVMKPCGRVLRFAVEIGGLGDISGESLKNRGEAIIAMVNSLEMQGHSVEITVVRAWKNQCRENYSFLIPIKAAGLALDVKRLQFMLGNPAFFRRCLFGIAEIAHGESFATCSTSTRNYRPEGFIHIAHENGRFDTLSESLAWAKSFALQFSENQN